MELKRNLKGLKKYESLLHTICRIDDYSQLTECEWEGCLGIACVISVVEGVSSNLFALSKHLDINRFDTNLQNAFDRLRINGIFSKRYDVRNDPSLTGNAFDSGWQSGVEVERNAWCIVAGIAGGNTGMKEGCENIKID